jgi:hypothetical protein
MGSNPKQLRIWLNRNNDSMTKKTVPAEISHTSINPFKLQPPPHTNTPQITPASSSSASSSLFIYVPSPPYA